jgi:protein-S-isoprenylcysteine O-methyltransferase Ste14
MTVPLLWQIFYWTWVASEVIIAIATYTKRGSGQTHDRGSIILLWITIFTSITLATWLSETTPANMFGGTRILKLFGLIVLIVAVVIRWTAILTLGKSFSSNVAILDSQKLNRSGLYRFVRHPSYLGLLLVFLAIGLHSRNWRSFAIVLIPCTAAVLYRIHVEESALHQAFGAEYAAYSRTTKRLLPGLY